MRFIFKYLFVATILLFSVASCDIFEDMHNTPHPDDGAIAISVDWSGRGPSIAVPKTYNISIAHLLIRNVPAEEPPGYYLLEPLLFPMVTDLFVYNLVEGITFLNQDFVADSIGSEKWPDVPNFVPSIDWLFVSYQEVEIKKDTINYFDLKMEQASKEITFTMEFTGVNSEKITRIESYLTGVASIYNFKNNRYSEPANIELNFTQITEGEEAGMWQSTVGVLGIAAEEIKLISRIYLEAETEPIEFTSDMSPWFIEGDEHFNADKKEPLLLFRSFDMAELEESSNQE